MKILQKAKNKDFIVLNLSDPQMCDFEWEEGHPYRPILEYTIGKLVEQYKPDLITVTGDMAYPGHDRSYELFAQLMDSFGIPWTVVWGNHDHQEGIEPVLKTAEVYKKHPLCLFEDGDPAYGNGNYILAVNEGDAPITALFMIDSHNSTEITLENGEKKWVYDKLWPDQLAWIGEQAAALKEAGYKDGMMMLHIPLYCYRAAAEMAFPGGRGGDSDIYGQQHELIAAHPREDGVLATLKESGLITHVLAGHDHCNNFIVEYEGIKLMFAYKTGPGCYWQSTMNGGTVITIGEDGIKNVHQQYVDVSHLVEGKGIHEFVYNWDN
ncbi:MAG: metallophosphoesterase [Clostridia bacterium]|nr:metallophosphoesterase [Clostridia bacterium]